MAWKVGEEVGPYKIIEQLGQGGMATVYKAYHPQLDRHVAIKVMHQNMLDDASFISRFKREAQIVARLEHPHIVPVYDFNEQGGQPYLVMKFIEGQTLKEQLADGVLPLDQIQHVMTAVGAALTYAHEQGVLHRDVKPSNIVIDSSNTPYLADFGLARIAQSGESSLSADMVLGTPHYISPEQAKGEKDLDGRADIYSLGVVLYELMVGRVPFTADTPFAVIHDHIYTPLPLPSDVIPDFPASVENVLVQALAKQPSDRFATASELVDDFDAAAKSESVVQLSEDRASMASESLARWRQEYDAQYSNQDATPVIPDISPIPASGVKTGVVYQANPNGRFWMMGGLGAFLLIAFLAIAVLLGAWNNILLLVELAGNNPDVEILHDNANAIHDDPLTVESGLYDAPLLSLDEARANQQSNAFDPISYLALAKANWSEGDQASGYSAIQRGKVYTENEAVYWATAAMLADESELMAAAFSYAVLAFQTALDAPEENFTVRSVSGQYLLTDVDLHRNDFEIGQGSRELIAPILSANNLRVVLQAPILRLTVAHNRIKKGQARAAALAIQDINDDSPETLLVQAEINLAQDNLDAARSILERIVDMDSIPDWILDRADTLLTSIEE